jgi:hypothetical protein
MESQNLDAIVAELRKQRCVVNEKATALRSELGSLEKDMARMDAALVALTGEAKAASKGGKDSRPKRTTQTPSAKKADAIAAMRRVLEKEGVLESDALKKAVEAQLASEGFNRSGLAMRLKEASQDSQFVETPAGFRLAEESMTVSKTSSQGHGRKLGSSSTGMSSLTTAPTSGETESISKS